MKVAANELGWVRLNLNPAIWETIADKCREARDLCIVGDGVGDFKAKPRALRPKLCGQGCAPKDMAWLRCVYFSAAIVRVEMKEGFALAAVTAAAGEFADDVADEIFGVAEEH